MFTRILMVSVVLAALASSDDAQELTPGPDPSVSRSTGIPSFKADNLTLVQYRPLHVPSHHLALVAHEMLGRSLLIEERGALGRPMRNLNELGGQIIIYDTKENANRILKTLKALDVSMEEPEAAADAGDQASVMVEYSARFVPVSDLNTALGTFGDISYRMVGKRMIAARMPKSRVTEFTSFLERLDQPDPRVMLTCYLLKGEVNAQPSSGPQPPADVIRSLNAILPDLKFRSVGFSMVQSTVNAGRPIELSLISSEGSVPVHYELRFNPAAYDKVSGDMTVVDCELVRHAPQTLVQGVMGARLVLLRTDTVFQDGQFMVLGASGQDPVFMVIHARRMP